jgi:hypothetical protein
VMYELDAASKIERPAADTNVKATNVWKICARQRRGETERPFKLTPYFEDFAAGQNTMAPILKVCLS